MIEGINPIILFVKNFDECLEFYRDKLGLQMVDEDSPHKDFATFLVGGVEFSLHSGYDGSTKSPVSLHFLTSDINEEISNLKEMGVKFTHEAEKTPWEAYQATFVDPDGNEMILYQFG